MPSKLDISSALQTANQARTQEQEPLALEKKGKPVSLRITEADHNRFRALFARNGLNMSEGCIMAVTYIAELIEAGIFSISKAGIQDLRGRNK